MMKNNPEMRHDDPNARRVGPNQTSQIVWKFTKAGEFEFACLMIAKLVFRLIVGEIVERLQHPSLTWGGSGQEMRFIRA